MPCLILLGLPLVILQLGEPREEHAHRALLVAVLRALVLALDNEAGRKMGDAHRGVGLVDMLSAGA